MQEPRGEILFFTLQRLSMPYYFRQKRSPSTSAWLDMDVAYEHLYVSVLLWPHIFLTDFFEED